MKSINPERQIIASICQLEGDSKRYESGLSYKEITEILAEKMSVKYGFKFLPENLILTDNFLVRSNDSFEPAFMLKNLNYEPPIS